MSSVLEITIVRVGREHVFRDPWSASTFDAAAAFWGPDAVLAYTLRMGSREARQRAAEGGGVFDFDRRIALWYGGEDIAFDADARRAFRTLMRRQWPGWVERWADDGDATVDAFLGRSGNTYFAVPIPAVPADPSVGEGLSPADGASLREHLPLIASLLRRRLELPPESADEAAELARRAALIAALEVELGAVAADAAGTA